MLNIYTFPISRLHINRQTTLQNVGPKCSHFSFFYSHDRM